MKHIVISTVFLILSISFFFGILAFAEWNINPYYWDVWTRILGSFMFFSAFVFWVVFVINYIIDECNKNKT